MSMSEPKRRFLERVSLPGARAATIVAAGTVIRGDVHGEGQFVISGEVHGDGVLEGVLHLAVTASWIGHIRAQHAMVAGKIEGSLTVEGKLEIGVTAVIRGRVSARILAIAKGAIVDGDIEVTSDVPIVQFEEKRRDP